MITSRVVSVFLVLLFAGCSTSHPVYNVQDSPVPVASDGQLPTMEEVNKAIFRAATYKRWRPSNLDEDTVQAKISVRNRHHATVNIDYSQRSYSITLVSSSGLDYRPGLIHRNYNKWVHLLDQQIQLELLNIED